MCTITVVCNRCFCIFTIFNNCWSGLTVAIYDSHSVCTVVIIHDSRSCIFTVFTSCTSCTVFTVFTIFNDSCSYWTITQICNGKCVSSIVIIYNFSFNTRTCFTSITFFTFRTCCTSVTFRTCCTGITFRTCCTGITFFTSSWADFNGGAVTFDFDVFTCIDIYSIWCFNIRCLSITTFSNFTVCARYRWWI